jgi:CheY-like chemotaxis protein
VSLRILFADDSMTAQNMGKKILSEAGYDVVAVSNGAAAVKKIAEQKPDIIILDVYMPGYTGLEVCEKVRGSIDTLKTPVLLTVGKMEPYKPEDANRVKADGVIIKPFEASDLLAIVKKFEERIGTPPPLAQQTAAVAEPQYDAPAEVPMETQTAGSRSGMQPLVEVPDHMASSAAFGDLLGGEPAAAASHFAVNTPSAAFETSVIVPAPPIVTADDTAVLPRVEETEEPAVAAPVPTTPEAVIPEMDASPEVTVTPVEPTPEPQPAIEEHAPAAVIQPEVRTEASHPQFIPVFKEPEAPVPSYDFIPTAAAPVDDVEIPREPALQETAEDATRNTIADRVEPGLMSAIEQPPAEEPHVASASPAGTGLEAQPAAEATAEVSDADFEARVAAAMAAYSQAESESLHSTPAGDERVRVADTHEVAIEDVAPAEVPSFEYQPPIQNVEPRQAEVEHGAVAISAEAVMPEAVAAAAADSGADHHTIAQAIHRVMERLKPELVEEIMKELRPKK